MKPMIKLVFILCLLAVMVIPAIAIIASAEEIHWESGGKTVLHKDENYTLDEYAVEVIDFDKDDGTVLLYFEKNDVFLSKFVLNATFDEYIYKDEIKINIYNTTDDILSNAPTIWEDPCIHIELSIKEKPCIYLAVDTDRIKYYPTDSEIRVTSKIINNGADIDNLYVSITPQELQVIGEISSDRVDIPNNSSKIVTTRLGIPSLLREQTFDIPVNLNWVDLNGVTQNLSRSTQISVLPICNLKITKTVRDSSMESHVPVRIDVKNTGIVNLTIELSDHVPQDFELVGDCDLNWHFDIKPQEKKSYPYYLKAQKPGEFPTEPAIAQWSIQGEDFNVTSNTPSIMIDGACIIINKTADPGEVDIGDNVTVTLLAINTGNVPATVYVTDRIPAGTRLLDGNTTLRTTLGKNQSVSTTYIIRMGPTGNITLPSPLVEIVNNVYSRVQISEMFSINVSAPLATTTGPEPAVQHQTEASPESGQPVFEIAFTILVTLLVGVLVWKIE
ncbi:MAG: hypothetical protein ACT6FF_00770 [Methanosarcinaceae archaeon]